jgi:hypothetical protein
MDRDAYFDAVPPARRDDLRRLDALIRETLPDAAPGAGQGMLGYGPVHYRYASGREGNTFLVSVASRKAGFSLYLFCADGEPGLPERYAERLGEVDVGKGCVRFKLVDDLDADVLREMLAEAGRLGAPAMS